MPELPEVETYARYFARHALGQPIVRVEVRDERILGEIRKDAFMRRLRRRSFDSVRRHGKHLFARAGEEWLHLHFGMSGDLAYYRDSSEEPRFARIIFHFEGGTHLAFEDMRLFGLAEIIDSPEDYIRERGLGPDPLDPSFDYERFAGLFASRRGALKSLLMSQEVIAGLGNLYVDEMLFQGGVLPRRAVDRVTDAERRLLFRSMRRILRDVLARHEKGKDHPPDYLIPNREEGERCPRCGGTIRRTVVFGRTTYFCAKHQK